MMYWCPCLSDADWCLQSDVTPDACLQARRLQVFYIYLYIYCGQVRFNSTACQIHDHGFGFGFDFDFAFTRCILGIHVRACRDSVPHGLRDARHHMTSRDHCDLSYGVSPVCGSSRASSLSTPSFSSPFSSPSPFFALQDPLSELLKIEPQHIGVGMYQHDVSEKLLRAGLDEVVEDCVATVGVNLNTAGAALLQVINCDPPVFLLLLLPSARSFSTFYRAVAALLSRRHSLGWVMVVVAVQSHMTYTMACTPVPLFLYFSDGCDTGGCGGGQSPTPCHPPYHPRATHRATPVPPGVVVMASLLSRMQLWPRRFQPFSTFFCSGSPGSLPKLQRRPSPTATSTAGSAGGTSC